MAASTAHAAPKSSKKKAVKVAHRNHSPAPSTASGAADATIDSQEDNFESPYIKELQKNIRNVNKKIVSRRCPICRHYSAQNADLVTSQTNASKTDSLLSQHAGKSLDELVAQKIINPDQKAQVMKKPALQAQLAQMEEQLVQYQKVHEQYRARVMSDKSEWEKSLDRAKADAVAEAKQEFHKSQLEHLLVLSQFLRLAAFRREEAKNPEADENQAIEGVLLAIYAGDEGAVASMLKLIEGSEEQILSVPGNQLQTTYLDVKRLAREPFPESAAPAESEPQEELACDPTVANAAATELDAGDGALVNGQATDAPPNGIPNASTSDDAANAAAESHWDCDNGTSISQGWEDLKDNEVNPGLNATPAEATNTQSWADEQPEPMQAPAATDTNDGFHQVQRARGRQDREGGTSRGRGRGEWRGRGRGDGRGRGRGRGNGGMASRVGRRAEES